METQKFGSISKISPWLMIVLQLRKLNIRQYLEYLENIFQGSRLFYLPNQSVWIGKIYGLISSSIHVCSSEWMLPEKDVIKQCKKRWCVLKRLINVEYHYKICFYKSLEIYKFKDINWGIKSGKYSTEKLKGVIYVSL